MVINDFVQIQKYCESFIFPLNHHTQITEAGVQDIATCLATGISKDDDSILISLRLIYIAPINHDILEHVKGRKRKGNRHMKSGVGDNSQPVSHQSKQRSRSGAEKLSSRIHPTSDKGERLIACSYKNI